MRTLFNLKPPSDYGILHSATWPYVRDGLRRNLATILRFYRYNPQAVQSSHFLVRLLTALSVPLSLNLERYFENVDAATFNTASALKMTSAINKGSLFKGIFYGPDCHEVLIAHNDFFDVAAADKNWQNMTPVTVARHPRSDLMMNIPDGRKTGVEYGIAVILINIPMLAVMYRAFVRNEEATGDSFSKLSVMHFIRMYVLPNMLYSHLDVALFNRIDNRLKGAPMGESLRQHSFAMPDYTKKVDAVHKEILDYIDKKRQDFLAVLHTIPGAIKNDMSIALELPDLTPTRQVVWALILARLPTIAFLFRAGRERINTLNQAEANHVRKAILSYRSDNALNNMLPVDYYYEAQTELDTIFDKSAM